MPGCPCVGRVLVRSGSITQRASCFCGSVEDLEVYVIHVNERVMPLQSAESAWVQ
jgi:hypothetical protein